MAVNASFAGLFGIAPQAGILGPLPLDPSQGQMNGLLAAPAPQPTMGVLSVPGDPSSLFSAPFNAAALSAGLFNVPPQPGVLGVLPLDPSQGQMNGLLPMPPAPQPTIGVLAQPGDPSSLFWPPFNPAEHAGMGVGAGGQLALAAAQMRTMQTIRDQLGDPFGWFTPRTAQGDAVPAAPAPTSATEPAVQAPPPAVTAGAQPLTAMTPSDGGALKAFDPFSGYALDRTFTVGPGGADGDVIGIANQLYPDNPVAGVGLLARANGLRTNAQNSLILVPGQALTAPALPTDDGSLAALESDGRSILSANDQGLRALAARRAAEAQREQQQQQPDVFTQRLLAGRNVWTGLPAGNSAAAISALTSGPNGSSADAGAGQNWLEGPRAALGTMFKPEVDAYENLIVDPFWNSLNALANSPLGDPGAYQTIQSLGGFGTLAGAGFGSLAKAFDGFAALGDEATTAEAVGDELGPAGEVEPAPEENPASQTPALFPDGSFSTVDWNGYPEGLDQPTGPFRILDGDEYVASRKAADRVNLSIHRRSPELKGFDLHEIQPVKFGGDPINPLNKVPLTPAAHKQVTAWWAQLGRDLQGQPK